MAVTKVRSGQINVNADFDINSNKLINITDPTAAQDAATKAYVDLKVNGLDWKASVRAATTANGTLATAFANGQVIDGITLATGDRILLKNQSSGSENGIYTVNASGAPTRATDADASAEVTPNLAVMIEEGTTLADTQWTITTNAPITLGTTALSFAQIGAGTTYTAADASIVITGTTIKTVTGTGGQVFIGNGSGILTPTTLSGDVSSVSSAGVVALATTVLKQASVVTRETPSGTVNGSNTAFTLANTPVSGTESIFQNGILLEPGAGNDYTISGAAITMLTAPTTGDKLRVSYLK